ncbi:hypothetical protein LINGRAHAP2_LOCUS11143 [Linum grandiflorum]
MMVIKKILLLISFLMVVLGRKNSVLVSLTMSCLRSNLQLWLCYVHNMR